MHHNDSPDLDARTDICDLYVFQKPGDLFTSAGGALFYPAWFVW